MTATGDMARRDLLRWLGLAGGMALVAPSLGALAGACGGSSATSPKPGGTVSMALSIEPAVLNPPVQTLAVESMVGSAIFAGLLRSRHDGRFEGDLAKDYRVDDGGMTYRFWLRPGLQWSDGRPLTSDDFRFTYETYVNPATRTTYLQGWDKIGRVETPDGTTVTVRMREPFAPFLLDVGTNAMLPRHVLSGTGDIRRSSFSRTPTGAGPFRLREWQTASRIVLEANPFYWRGRPSLDHLVFTIVPDAITQVDQLQAGEVDIISVSEPALWKQVQAMAPGVATVSYDDTRYALVQLDEYGALREVAVRQALDYATPKLDIVRNLLGGLATPAYTDVPPGSPYALSGVEHHDHDPGKARALLQNAGFRMQNGVMTRGGQPLEVPIYTIPNSPAYVSIAQALEASWSGIGVRTSVTTREASTLFSNQGPQWSGRDAALIFSWGQGRDPYNFVNWSSTQIPGKEDDPGENAERYSNPAMDRLVVEGGRTTEFGARKHVYDQIQRILARDVPVIFLYWPKALYAHSARVRGFAPDAFAGVLNESWNWTTS